MVDLYTQKASKEWLFLIDAHLNELKAHVKNELKAQKIYHTTDGLVHQSKIEETVKMTQECLSTLRQILVKPKEEKEKTIKKDADKSNSA